MTTFVFENMSASDAANFQATDRLIFSSSTLQPGDVVATSSNNQLNLVYLQAASKTLVFDGAVISQAHIDFTSAFIVGGDQTLVLGSFGNDDLAINTTSSGSTAYAFYGNDHLTGGMAADRMYGGGGSDTIEGGGGDDRLYGFAPSGTQADDGADSLDGGAGNDYLQGDGGNDTLNGGAGDDMMLGGAGNDSYYVDSLADSITEDPGAGTDTVIASASYALGANIENLVLSGSQPISGTGNALDNAITGNDQDNQLFGGGGSDTLDGGLGADTLAGEAGDDVYLIGNSGDSVVEAAGGGNDRVTTSVTWTLSAGQEVELVTAAAGAAVNLTGNELANTLNGNDVANALNGAAGADTLNGAGGNDTLDGGAGNDQMAGGVGDDVYYVDSASDIVSENAGEGIDLVMTSAAYTLGQNVENLALVEGAQVAGTGNGLDNVLTGNSLGNQLSGAAGNDTLDGGAGDDNVSGDDGHDVLLGGDGADTLNGGDGNDHLYGQSASGGVDAGDLINAGNGSDYLQGNAGNDTLDGGDGSDRINGGANDDLINGSTGNDTINGNLGNDTVDGGADNDSIRGGQGNDSIVGGGGNDMISGDLGSDTLTGGQGQDIFVFSGQSSLATAPDRITDFTVGTDHLSLGFTPLAVLTGAVQASLSAAVSFAQQLFDGHSDDHEVAALAVGSDTYIFYANTGGNIVDSAILLIGVGANSIGVSAFT